MTDPALYRRVLRRETHSPRSGAAITIAILLILVAAWIGVESVLVALGQAPLLAAPPSIVSSALQAAASPVALLVAIGAVVAVVGFVLIIVSLAPGRRGRRGSVSARSAAIVEDRVIAQSLAQTASYAGNVDPSQVNVAVGARTALVAVTPTSGITPDQQRIRDAVERDVAGYDYRPAIRTRVQIAKKGTVA